MIKIRILCLLFLLALPSLQNAKAQIGSEGKNMMSGDPDFEVLVSPSKWEKNSAVILCQKASYSYLRRNKLAVVEEVFRRRILLQDQAAVKQFTTFYFASSQQNKIKINVVKPDGSKIEVDISKAIKDNLYDVPGVFKSYYGNTFYGKLAVSNLQVGDIIDYSYSNVFERPIGLTTTYSAFNFNLASSYPILKQKFDFQVDRGFYINFNTYLGAPKILKGPPGKDARGRTRATIRTYSFVDEERDPVPEERWSMPLVEFPSVKFQVMLQGKDTNSGYLKGKIGEVKNSFTPEEIGEAIKLDIQAEFDVVRSYSNRIEKFLEQNFSKNEDAEVLIKNAYGYFQALFLQSNNLKLSLTNAENHWFVRDILFVGVMNNVLSSRSMPVEIIAYASRSNSTFDNIMVDSEIRLAVKVEDLIIFPFSNSSQIADALTFGQGSRGYAYSVNSNYIINTNGKPFILPLIPPEENTGTTVLKMALDDELEKISVERSKSLVGRRKVPYGFVLRESNYIEEVASEYDISPSKLSQILGGYEESKYEKLFDRVVEAVSREDLLIEYLERDFNIDKYHDFELLSSGINNADSSLSFRDKFIIKDLVTKVGPNHLLQLGKLLGSQIVLEQEELENRVADINLPYAYINKYSIELKAPDGIRVEGLDAFNFSKKNPFGSIVSSGKMVNDIIVVEFSLTLASHTLPKENWEHVVELLSWAHKIGESKVVLKQKN